MASFVLNNNNKSRNRKW